ncbi:MAG: HepT-like ribonuclease domain-containing protein [Bacteroidota bacterium]
MDSEIYTWLFDIQTAIEEIDQFLPEGNRVFENYKADLKTRRAIERNLEIIGEAVKRIIDKDLTVEIKHSRKIISLRNRIIHGYDVISDELVWGVIINDLPQLKEEIFRFFQ